MVASRLKIVITRNTICDNLVGFPKSGHILRLTVVATGDSSCHTEPSMEPMYVRLYANG